MKTNRRQFIGGVGALAASTFPMPAFAQAKPKVVVIGGGPGGATVAKYVAKDGGIDVTLVEPARRFTTCFHSNLYLGGFKTWESITHSYDKIAKAYGIKHVRQMAAAIDRDEAQRAARQRHRAALRPAGDRARDRPEVRFGARLFGGGQRQAAARLEGRSADPAAAQAAQCAVGRRDDRDDRAAQSLSLPARPLRAHLDDGACAQGQGPQEIAHRRPRSEAELLQAGRCSWRAGRSTIPA